MPRPFTYVPCGVPMSGIAMAPQLLYFLAVCVLLRTGSGSAFHRGGNSDNLRIYSGDEISIGKAPFMAALFTYDNDTYKPVCGATIVHQYFVMTAAHCIRWTSNATSRSVLVGSNRLDDNVTMIEVEKAICHEKARRISSYDIALLKLRKPVEFVDKKVAPVQLPDNKDFKLEKGTPVQITGWGKTEDGLVKILHQTTAVMDSWEKCSESFGVDVICTVSKDHGPCRGDSGGPLTYNNIQIGVISFGFGCGNGLDVYTNVAICLDWINTTITNNL